MKVWVAHVSNSGTQEAEAEVQVQGQSGLRGDILSKERNQGGEEERRKRGDEMRKDIKKTNKQASKQTRGRNRGRDREVRGGKTCRLVCRRWISQQIC